jgi:hypothetical protein
MKEKWAAVLIAGTLLVQAFGCVRDVPPSSSKSVRLSVPNLMSG